MPGINDKEIVAAERQFYEGCYYNWLTAGGLMDFGHNQNEELMAAWARRQALFCVEEWRKLYAPERIGLPLQGEWTV